MSDREQRELSVARYIVGGVVFFAAWWIWNALGISVLAIQSTNPQLSSTGFSLGVIGTEILGPLLLAVGFLLSGAGKLVLSFVVRVISRFDAPPVSMEASADVSKMAVAAKVTASFKLIDARVKSLETTVAGWEAGDE